MSNLLLCTDLDRTLLPNGREPESPQARPLLRILASRPDVTLVYVTGRSRELILEVMEEYQLPSPTYAIGDVGTTLYRVARNWRPCEEWQVEIGQDWKGKEHCDLARLLDDLKQLKPQELAKQNRYKLSYYVDHLEGHGELVDRISRRLRSKGVEAAVIWSVDEIRGQGLVDVIPQRATKLHSILFLIEKKGFRSSHTVFAGDSGNDLPVLASAVQSVLVKNASVEVRERAFELATLRGNQDKLYLARGDFLGMNGNYAAGILEGLAHFLPQTRSWIDSALAEVVQRGSAPETP